MILLKTLFFMVGTSVISGADIQILSGPEFTLSDLIKAPVDVIINGKSSIKHNPIRTYPFGLPTFYSDIIYPVVQAVPIAITDTSSEEIVDLQYLQSKPKYESKRVHDENSETTENESVEKEAKPIEIPEPPQLPSLDVPFRSVSDKLSFTPETPSIIYKTVTTEPASGDFADTVKGNSQDRLLVIQKTPELSLGNLSILKYFTAADKASDATKANT